MIILVVGAEGGNVGLEFWVKQRAGRHGFWGAEAKWDGWKGRKRGVARALGMFRVAGA